VGRISPADRRGRAGPAGAAVSMQLPAQQLGVDGEVYVHASGVVAGDVADQHISTGFQLGGECAARAGIELCHLANRVHGFLVDAVIAAKRQLVGLHVALDDNKLMLDIGRVVRDHKRHFAGGGRNSVHGDFVGRKPDRDRRRSGRWGWCGAAGHQRANQ